MTQGQKNASPRRMSAHASWFPSGGVFYFPLYFVSIKGHEHRIEVSGYGHIVGSNTRGCENGSSTLSTAGDGPKEKSCFDTYALFFVFSIRRAGLRCFVMGRSGSACIPPPPCWRPGVNDARAMIDTHTAFIRYAPQSLLNHTAWWLWCVHLTRDVAALDPVLSLSGSQKKKKCTGGGKL